MYVYLPVTKGTQANMNIFSAMVSLKELKTLFILDDEELPVELRQQRELNEKRVSEFAKYVINNRSDYVTGSLTATYDDDAEFIPLDSPFVDGGVGVLKIPATSQIIFADGQHRRTGLLKALEDDPSLINESLPVTLYKASDLARKQQIFSDINKTPVKPASSLSVTFDHRSELNKFVKEVLAEIPKFKNKVDMQHSSVGAKSAKAWPLVSVKKAFTYFTGLSEKQFAQEVSDDSVRKRIKQLLISFINNLDKLEHFEAMLNNSIQMTELRSEFITSHAVFLEAVFMWGNQLLTHMNQAGEENWELMDKLSNITLSKSSIEWAGRCVDFRGRMNKSSFGVKSTAAKLCQLTDIKLNSELEKAEDSVNASLENLQKVSEA